MSFVVFAARNPVEKLHGGKAILYISLGKKMRVNQPSCSAWAAPLLEWPFRFEMKGHSEYDIETEK
jgi:hypothetical protein